MKKDLTGKQMGDFFVIGVSEKSRNGHYRYHVKCKCGTEKTILGTHMIQGNTLNCGCKKRKPRNWKGYKKVSSVYFNSIKRGANGGKGRKPINFDVTIEYVGDLLEEQDYKCALSGLNILIYDKTASLDRIDSSKGYEEGNLQWLHKDVNMMKRHYTQKYFKHLCNLVTERKKSANST